MSNAQSHNSAGTLWRVGGVPWAVIEPVSTTGRSRAAGRNKAASRPAQLTTEPWQDWMIGFLGAFFGLLVLANVMIPVPQDTWVRSLLRLPMRAASYGALVGGGLSGTGAVYYCLRKRYPNLTRGLGFGMLMAVLVQVALLLYWGSLSYSE